MVSASQLGVIGLVSYTYNAATGDLGAVGSEQTGTFTYQHESLGGLEWAVKSDGSRECHFLYDASRQMAQRIETAADGTVLHNASTQADGRGKALQVKATRSA